MRLKNFFAATAFLSRIPAPASASAPPAMAWFGTVGLFMGLFCVFAEIAAALLLASPIYNRGAPPFACALFCGLVWLASEIWLSRCLHWDGLADVGDALGSGGRGEKFRQILKDSRLGSFGAILLFFVLLSQWLAASIHFLGALPDNDNLFCLENWNLAAFAPLCVACAWSRLAPAWIARKGAAQPGSWLGAEICRQASRGLRMGAWLYALAIVTLLGLCGLAIVKAAILLFGQFLINHYLLKTAIAHGGLSGDFFGAGIELGQTFFLLMTL